MMGVFRMIKGRIVYIKTVTKKHPTTGQTDISVQAKSGLTRVGEVWGTRSSKKKSRFLVGSHINPKFRAQGLGTDMYKRLADAIRKNDGRWMQGHTGNYSAIKKVRGRIGKTRMTGRRTFDWQVTTDLKKRKKK